MSQYEQYLRPPPNSPAYSSRASSPDLADSDSGRPFKRLKSQASSRIMKNKRAKESSPRTKPRTNFPCSFAGCLEAFSRKHDRMRHEVIQHSRRCEWSCDQCRKFFSTEKTLAKHKCSRVGDLRWLVP